MRILLSLLFWSQYLKQVIFQGSQSLNEEIWAQIKSTFAFTFTRTPSEYLHDPLYDSMIYTVEGSVEGTEDGKLGVVDNLITYQLEIYPSLTFETQYVTNAPAIYTTIVAMIFLDTSGVFLLYDLAVKYKHNEEISSCTVLATNNILWNVYYYLLLTKVVMSNDNSGRYRIS